ncbi:MAG TPA: SOS response-associated peptidase [Acidimicrobiales bacterium]|nr:SOS response-associated peptidase [Acidimicrobiales bacterium]
MCGRVALFTPPVRLAKLLDAALAAGVEPEGHPSWNVGPQRRLFAVAELDGQRVLDRYRWGLLPSWAKDPALANRLFNARGETVAEKPSFRSAFAKRPCAIPVDGFYEWDHRPGKSRQPYYFTRADGEPMIFAGLFEHWRDPQTPDSPVVATCTIITTTPSADMDEIHDRMPVVLERDEVSTWLDVLEVSGDERLSLLRPAPVGTLKHHGVASAVGSIKNDGPELIDPLETQSLF